MNLKKKLSYFWNVTLGEDYPETEDVKKSKNPEFAKLKKSLKKSLNRIEEMENTYSKPASSSKGGKGSIVQNVSVDEKAAAEVAEAKKGNKEQAKEIEEK